MHNDASLFRPSYLVLSYDSIESWHEKSRFVYLHRSRVCTWCCQWWWGSWAAQWSTAGALVPCLHPAQCSWWSLYPEPPAQTAAWRKSPPLYQWSPPCQEQDLNTHKMDRRNSDLWLTQVCFKSKYKYRCFHTETVASIKQSLVWVWLVFITYGIN